ncbi:MAG: glycosyl hydrolase, partial [Akkermansiaceae bacterium]
MDGSLLLLGVKGPELTSEEVAMFRNHQPAGFILFIRNIEISTQVRRQKDDQRGLWLVEQILGIDQEG